VPSVRTATCGGRGRPLYRDDMDAPYAPASRMATRSPRRSGGRSWTPSVSVDSQMGPSTAVGTASGLRSPGSIGRPIRVSAKTRFRHYLNLDRTESRLDRLLSDFRWDRIDRVFEIDAA